jgi:hypothetical protein
MDEDFGTGFGANTQRRLWNLLENPHHSSAAKVRIIYTEQHSGFLYRLVAFILTEDVPGCGGGVLHVCGGLHSLSHSLNPAHVPAKGCQWNCT